MMHKVMANTRSNRHPIETPIAMPIFEESSESVVKHTFNTSVIITILPWGLHM